jgi:hypothetical protein
MSRPELNVQISAADFEDFYWLKSELIDFCRANNLPSSGSKDDLTRRIKEFLVTGQVLPPDKRSTPKGSMPNIFTSDTVIGPGWRCSQALRAFFEAEIGSQFHFDGVMRDLIRHGEGRTLQEIIEIWYRAKQNPHAEKEIAPQFEYNRFFRAFFKANPGATRQEAVAAWKEKRAKRYTEQNEEDL